MGKRLLIKSSKSKIPHEGFDLILNWDSHQDLFGELSIPKEIEKNSKLYRDLYLQWIFKFENTEINKSRIVDQLEIRPGFSAWYLSLIFEKSRGKSSNLYSVFQLLAFEKIAQEIEVDLVLVNIESKTSASSIEKWCKKNKIKYKNKKITSNLPSSLKHRLTSFLPFIFQAFLWLLRQIFFRNTKLHDPQLNSRNNKNNICFISYFFNLEIEKIRKGYFYSRYWTKLHDILPSIDANIFWSHIFHSSDECRKIKDASKLIKV